MTGMRPMWVTESSIRKEQAGDKPPTFLVRLENNSQCVEVRMSARRLAALLEEAQRAVPDELVPAR
jgi:hypothetical protein